MPPQITRVQFVVTCNIKTVPSFVTELLQPSIPLSRHCCMQYLVITYVKYFFEKNKPSLFFFQRKKRKVKIILRSRIVESIFKICFLFIIEFQFSVLIKEARQAIFFFLFTLSIISNEKRVGVQKRPVPIIISHKNIHASTMHRRKNFIEQKYRSGLIAQPTFSLLLPLHFDDINVDIDRGRSKGCRKKEERDEKRKKRREKQKSSGLPRQSNGNQLKHLKARDSCVIQRIFERIIPSEKMGLLLLLPQSGKRGWLIDVSSLPL